MSRPSPHQTIALCSEAHVVDELAALVIAEHVGGLTVRRFKEPLVIVVVEHVKRRGIAAYDFKYLVGFQIVGYSRHDARDFSELLKPPLVCRVAIHDVAS